MGATAQGTFLFALHGHLSPKDAGKKNKMSHVKHLCASCCELQEKKGAVAAFRYGRAVYGILRTVVIIKTVSSAIFTGKLC
jgi:hypothetical protein